MKILCRKSIKCSSMISRDERRVLEEGVDNILYELYDNYKYDDQRNDLESVKEMALEHMPDEIQAYVDAGALPDYYLDTFDADNFAVEDPEVVRLITNYVEKHYNDYNWGIQ